MTSGYPITQHSFRENAEGEPGNYTQVNLILQHKNQAWGAETIMMMSLMMMVVIIAYTFFYFVNY